ncbi:MAG: TonB-dependent receptor, partial [Opitutales bacterium]|nr:TonB-dependent receptor [Opitutales bacterium]
MKNVYDNALRASLMMLTAALPLAAQAQDDGEEIFELSPFTIQADESEGYSATSTLAGTRLKTDLRDLGAAISVLTPQMFEDTGATDAETVLAYGLNTEISGAHGNFAQANVVRGVADTVENRRESHKANRVRGLAEATLTRGQFLT